MFFGPKQSANAYLIQFNSVVPQQVLALPQEPERRFLAADEEAWLMQFVAKDFLSLANFGQLSNCGGDSAHGGGGASGYGGHGSIDGSSFHTNPISEASGMGSASNAGSQRPDDRNGGGGGGSSGSEDNHWLKVITIEQLGIAATTLYFSFTQEDDNGRKNRHSFAVVITTPGSLGHKVALRSICDRLTHIHARVTSIFFNEDGDDYFASPSSSNNNENGGGNNNNAPIGVGTLLVGPSSDRNLEDNGTSTGDSLGHLSGKDQPQQSTHNPTAGHATSHHTNNDDLMQYEAYDESLGYSDIWKRELEAAVADITVWVNGMVDRHKIPLKRTLIDELRRTAFMQSATRSNRMLGWFEQILSMALSEHRFIITGDKTTVEQLLNTLALFVPDDRLLMASTQCFQGFIVPDLSFQGTTLPISKIKTRLVWFRYPVAIIDVSKQQMLDRPCHYLPTRESGKKVYAVFREWRREQIKYRRTLPMGKFMLHHLSPNRVVSPIVQVIARRFLNYIGFSTVGIGGAASGGGGGGGGNNNQQQQNVGGGGVSPSSNGNTVGGGGGAGSSNKSDPNNRDNLLRAPTAASHQLLGSASAHPTSYQTPLLNNASTTTVAAANNNPSVVSMSMGSVSALTLAATAAAGGTSITSMSLNGTLSSLANTSATNPLNNTMSHNTNNGAGPLSSSSSPNRRPLLGEETGFLLEGPGQGYPRPFYDALMFFLQQWRRTLMHRALAFYRSEMAMNAHEERNFVQPPALQLCEGDLHVMLATVELIYPVGAALEERASKWLLQNFDF